MALDPDLRNSTKSEGILAKATKDMIVVMTSQYEDGTGDFTVFPRSDCIKSVKRLK